MVTNMERFIEFATMNSIAEPVRSPSITVYRDKPISLVVCRTYKIPTVISPKGYIRHEYISELNMSNVR